MSNDQTFLLDAASWRVVSHLLAAVEERYRKERLRNGPKANELPSSEEAAVLRAVMRACELYLEAPANEREEMRSFFAATYSLPHRLWRVSGKCAEQAERCRSDHALRLAFAALSLEDGHTDCRDTFLAIPHLHAIAASVQLDSAGIQSEIAQLSSSRMKKLLLSVSLDMGDFA